MKKPDWNSNVQPRRVVKERGGTWLCSCEYPGGTGVKVEQPAYRVNCPDCFARRPGS